MSASDATGAAARRARRQFAYSMKTDIFSPALTEILPIPGSGQGFNASKGY
jgi:hypothetical protein